MRDDENITFCGKINQSKIKHYFLFSYRKRCGLSVNRVSMETRQGNQKYRMHVFRGERDIFRKSNLSTFLRNYKKRKKASYETRKKAE